MGFSVFVVFVRDRGGDDLYPGSCHGYFAVSASGAGERHPLLGFRLGGVFIFLFGVIVVVVASVVVVVALAATTWSSSSDSNDVEAISCSKVFV